MNAAVRLDERFLREVVGACAVVVREPAQKIPQRRLVPPNEQLERTSIIGGNDEVHGFIGDDFVSGGTGDDRLYGEDGDDTLEGGAGHDYLDGGEGYDRVFGGDGDDWLYGGDGYFGDELYGGAGADTLNGGGAGVLMYGGAGSDTFYVNSIFDLARERIKLHIAGTTVHLFRGGR